MDSNDKEILLRKYDKELQQTDERDLERTEKCAKLMYTSSEKFIALVEAFSKMDIEEGTNYSQTLPPVIFASIAMDITKSTDEALGLLNLWFEYAREAIAEADRAINKG